MFHDISEEMQNTEMSNAHLQMLISTGSNQIEVLNQMLRENQLLRERNSQLTQLNNNLMIEISQLKLEIDMMELKKGWNFDDR